VSLVTARAFRLTISALYLGLSGYPDSGVNLQRTVWEISVRLLDMAAEPVAAALGFLLHGVASEVSHMEVEAAHRQKADFPLGSLPANLERWRTYRASLVSEAVRRGFDAETLQRRYGRLNVRDACRRFGIEKAYQVDYAVASGYVHPKGIPDPDCVHESPVERGFDLGPVRPSGEPIACVVDSLTNMTRVLINAANVVADTTLPPKVEELARRLTGIRGQDTADARSDPV
jgi:hypothetical protein